MKKAKIFVIAALAVAATVMPLSASAAAPASQKPSEGVQIGVEAPPTAAVEHQRPGACRHAWTHIFAEVTVRAEPRADSTGFFNLKPMDVACRALVSGGLYHAPACGPDNRGWILIAIQPYPRQGWIASQCTEDPILN